ncbi:MAG: crotonobetaine/carnitine-CoA ligase [Micrococcales bacterium 73-15]|uniref:crotonobetaine/carnitine-CoA ligase n=1 Tax=Salana multivorans TaxID=120377 RepID=UPI0009593653|nr:crotonobetaine/carnitine-CoA ligase [Salana multivorans]OJX93810.1 MAG: crotonobetaine/carnitine-CoA ligase [Micrococcales bacterium 73-15]
MDIVASRTVADQWRELARTCPDHTFLVHEDLDGRTRELTYGQVADQVVRTANLFHDLGVRRGDAVALHLGNTPEMVQCLFGLTVLGAVAVPLHPRVGAQECRDVLERVRASVVVAEPATAGMYDRGGATGGVRVDRVVVAGTGEPGGFEDLRDRRGAEPVFDEEPTSDDPATIVFTSGSTARPKGVVVTHANLLFSGIFVGWQASLRPEDRLLTTMPACHVNFQLNALMPVVMAGATLVMVERYSANRFWGQVRAHGATVVQAIATILRTLLLQPERAADRDNDVREVLYYLPVTDEEKERFEDRFGVRILNSYGNSECLVGAITDPPLGERRWPSIGRVGLGYEARVVDEDGREVPPGVEGEIRLRGVRGRTLMLEYFEDPEATAAAFDADGWLLTGDIGYVDHDGWFYFVDRRSHFIKRAGENISPAQVEGVLTSHPDIADAAVVGIPDPIHDEAVKAVVVPRPGARLDVEAVLAYCRERLADFKVPGVVEVVDRLPQTRSLKVAKTELTAAAPPAPRTTPVRTPSEKEN